MFPEYKYTVPCPSDPSLSGYITLTDLNAELRQHASALGPPLNQTLHGGDADAGDLQYKYILCPHTIFHVTTDSSGTMSNPLTLPPQLLEVHGDGGDDDVSASTTSTSTSTSTRTSTMRIQCGRDGWSSEECQIHGGETQVLVLDDDDDDSSNTANTTSTSKRRQAVTFQGISFVGSQDISVAALSTRTHATFIDCHWKDSQGSAAIFIAKGYAIPLSYGDSATNPGGTTQIGFALEETYNSADYYSYHPKDDEDEEKEEGDNIFKTRTRRRRRRRQRQQLRRVLRGMQPKKTTPTSAASTSTSSTIGTIGTGRNTAAAVETTMKVTFRMCTFQNCGDQIVPSSDDDTDNDNDYDNDNEDSASSSSFVLVDSRMPGAHVELELSRIQSIVGDMVLNIEQEGRLTLERTVLQACATSVAVIRATQQSIVEVFDSTIVDSKKLPPSASASASTSSSSSTSSNNNGEKDGTMAAIAVVDQSVLRMRASRVHDNTVELAPIVILDASQATIDDSCLSVFDAPNHEEEDGNVFQEDAYSSSSSSWSFRSVSVAAMVVDHTSTLEETRTSLTRRIGTWSNMPSRPLSFLCQGDDENNADGVPTIWRLEEDLGWSCFWDTPTVGRVGTGGGGGSCQGSCEGLRQATCPVTTSTSDDIPYRLWPGATQSTTSSAVDVGMGTHGFLVVVLLLRMLI